MTVLRVDLPPVRAVRGIGESEYRAVARLVTRRLTRAGIHTYTPAADVRVDADHLAVCEGMTVALQYDITRDAFTRAGFVEVPSVVDLTPCG